METGGPQEKIMPITTVKTSEMATLICVQLSEGFLSLYWAYTAKIAGEFDGTFPLVYDDESSYANKSQYLKDVVLVGNNNTSIIASDLCNFLAGNPGNNTFWPKKGVDYIDGECGDTGNVCVSCRCA